jgi:hypothetical protein
MKFAVTELDIYLIIREFNFNLLDKNSQELNMFSFFKFWHKKTILFKKIYKK